MMIFSCQPWPAGRPQRSAHGLFGRQGGTTVRQVAL